MNLHFITKISFLMLYIQLSATTESLKIAITRGVHLTTWTMKIRPLTLYNALIIIIIHKPQYMWELRCICNFYNMLIYFAKNFDCIEM